VRRGPVGLLGALLFAGLAAGAVTVPEALPGAEPFPPDLRGRLARTLAAEGAGYVPRTQHVTAAGAPLYSNRLLLETSPYLRQHAHNPVDWRPWGEEAFAAARRLDRPLFVSIGYSTCHWCHVMEERCFDVPEIAAILNAHFVAVKVDREERPDVDAIYMAALHEMNGRGGWPLNVFLTPDGKPFYGGTYFPPEDSGGRPGFPTVLRTIHARWVEERPRIHEAADSLAEAVSAELGGAPALASRVVDASVLRRARGYYGQAADPTWGGVGRVTKFPSSLPIRFLLRYHRRTGDREALDLALLTLEKMAAGGIRDHLGGGFHRYSVDRRWLVPHFEKMLYDNALLVQAYVEAWQLSGREDFAAIARQVLTFVEREMTSPEGGFYSALDADSTNLAGELEEGFFYTWTPAELERVLGADEAAAAGRWYGVSAGGQVEGRSVLHTWSEPSAVAGLLGTTPEALAARIDAARPLLLEARETRSRPLRDDKIIAGWNGLMIGAYARAGLALDEPDYVAAAARAARFVRKAMHSELGLARIHKDGVSAGRGFLEDYAFLVSGLLDLYEADSDPEWLAEALVLQSDLDRGFSSGEAGAYYRTGRDHERLLARETPARDGAIPSGNSVAALNLQRLYQFTLDPRHLERAGRLFSALHAELVRNPAQLSELLLAVDYHLDTPKEVVLVADAPGDELERMLAPLRSAFLPNRALVILPAAEGREKRSASVPWLRGKVAVEGRVTAYVCEDQVCELPTSDPAVLAAQLAEVRRLE
jgi:uncharacterized protein YyaL (SSP411 family)